MSEPRTTTAELLDLIHPTAEITVLAAMRDDTDQAIGIAEMLTARDFYDLRRSVVFEAISNILRTAEPVDVGGIVTEAATITKERNLSFRIDAAYVNTLYGETGRGEAYAATVKRLAWLRNAGDFAFWLAEKLQGRPDPMELFTEAQERWQHMQPAQVDSGFVYGWETIDQQRASIAQHIKEHEDGSQQLFDWPWALWNTIVRPLRPGMVGLVAAPSGMGKTTYLEMIAEHWAKQGHQVVYVHLEDSLPYKLDRRTARHSFVPINAIEDGNLSHEQRRQVADAEHAIGDWAGNLHYYQASGRSMVEIVREMKSRVAEGVCQCVVLDYLDKVRASRGQINQYGDNNWKKEADDVEALKTFAEQAGVVVMTASQGNKAMMSGGVQTRQNVRGSGEKTEKVQLAVILTRDIVGEGGQTDVTGKRIAEPGQYSPVVNVRIDKQNRGQTGNFRQVIRGEHFRVHDPDMSKRS